MKRIAGIDGGGGAVRAFLSGGGSAGGAIFGGRGARRASGGGEAGGVITGGCGATRGGETGRDAARGGETARVARTSAGTFGKPRPTMFCDALRLRISSCLCLHGGVFGGRTAGSPGTKSASKALKGRSRRAGDVERLGESDAMLDKCVPLSLNIK